MLTLAFLCLFGHPAVAMETDQYLVWGRSLADSSDAVNDFVNLRFERVLARVNRRSGDALCEQLPAKLFRDLQRTLVSSKLRRFLRRSDRVEIYPGREVGYWQYRRMSIFRRKAFPLFLPMSRTLRIGDVYLGTDKLGHFFGFGRRYLAYYRRAVGRGSSDEAAQRGAVLRALKQERLIVGGLVDGVISNADLEANYQGFRLAMDLCDGDSPYLVRSSGEWRLDRPVDLRDYVNPAFDESYYPSHFLWYRWRLVRPILMRDYCSRRAEDAVRRRFELYRSLDHGSFSRRVVAERNARRGRRPAEHFSSNAICATREPAAEPSRTTARAAIPWLTLDSDLALQY